MAVPESTIVLGRGSLKIRLDRLLSKAGVRELVVETAQAVGGAIRIRDARGVTLLGEDAVVGKAHPVSLEGDILGHVFGGECAVVVARLLSQLATHEREKKVLAQEALGKYYETSLLISMAERVSASMDAEEVGRVIVTEGSRLFLADGVVVYIQDEGLGGYRELARRGAPLDFESILGEGARATLGGCLCFQPVIRNAPPAENGEVTSTNDETNSLLCAPMRVKDKVIGCVAVYNRQGHPYRSEELKLLQSLATQVAAPLESARLYDKLNSILSTIEEVNNYSDLDTILDKVLYESRKIANADAGSIFLVEDETLVFCYVHNDTLFGEDTFKELYSRFTVPISERSIVGYAALTGKTVIIDHAYALPPGLPYAFNSTFDRTTGYHTTSILTIPLKTYQDRLVGVMQIINSKNEAGESVPFSQESRSYIPLFANTASATLEQAILTREQVLRTMKLAELRDPNETGAHVQRVGAYSAEIYQRWAAGRGLGRHEVKRVRDRLRLAAMLHDVGKVGISDEILKKPGRLNPAEFNVIKWHTVFGARLFADASSELDRMCYDIALGHHEKWAGGGYPGALDDLLADGPLQGQSLEGEAIPITARIVALADVYDALCSRRVYKDAWPEDQVLNLIREESGQHFDPALVRAFFEIYDVIRAIRHKFKHEENG